MTSHQDTRNPHKINLFAKWLSVEPNSRARFARVVCGVAALSALRAFVRGSVALSGLSFSASRSIRVSTTRAAAQTTQGNAVQTTLRQAQTTREALPVRMTMVAPPHIAHAA
jgi:hypothetical protein